MVTFIQQTEESANREPLELRWRSIHEIDSDFIAQWLELERWSLDPNPYLSPHFVIPALRLLHEPSDHPLILAVGSEVSGSRRLVGLGVFESVPASWRMPFPHLRAYQSPHSFMSGLLLAPEFGSDAVALFVRHLTEHSSRYGIEFLALSRGEAYRFLSGLNTEWGGRWHEYRPIHRAILTKDQSGPEYLDELLSSRRKKALRRAYRQLATNGEVTWRVARGRNVEEAAEVFLDLEHRGWKAEQGSSLRSNPSHEVFFRNIVENFAAHERIFFAELLVGGRVIASSVNLISGEGAFAFKIGWDPAHAAGSPGLLNEVEFVRNFPIEFPGLRWVDSGAEEGSFIETLWQKQRVLSSGFFALHRWGSSVALCLEKARKVRSALRGKLQPFESAPGAIRPDASALGAP